MPERSASHQLASLYRWTAIQVEKGVLRDWAERFAPGKSRTEQAALLRQRAKEMDGL